MKAYIGETGKGKLEIPLENLKKHFVALGSSGSGKTVLSKVIIEEAALNGIPSIVVDPQGDLASFMISGDEKNILSHGLDKEVLDKYRKNVSVTVFTPMSSKGIPISINPLNIDPNIGDAEEIIPIIDEISSSIAKLLGYNIFNDKGKAASAIIYTILKRSFEKKDPIGTFENLVGTLSNPNEALRKEIEDFAVSDNDMKVLIRKVKFLTVGQMDLLFQMGVALDVNTLIGKGKDKTQISVIYLNTIPGQREKEFFLSILSTNIYQWMLSHPSSKIQFLYYIDEVAPFIPAGSEKPMPKPILMLLYKQARKYGVGCMVATQNPGDIDYKAFSQFGTWAIGRLTLKQDQKKVENALKSLSSIDISRFLPKLTPGRFVLFSPDLSDKLIDFKARWLYSEHRTLNDIAIKRLTTQTIRDKYKILDKPKKKPAVKKSAAESGNKDKDDSQDKEKTSPEKKSPKHFALKHDSDEIMDFIDRKKKRFFLIGPTKEDLASYKIVMRPLYRIKVAKDIFKWGVKREQKIYEILIDAISGSAVAKRGKFKWYENFSYYCKLNDTQLIIMKLLHKRVVPISVADISIKTKFSNAVCSKALSEMQKKRVVSFRKNGKHKFWFSTLIDALPDLLVISSRISNLSEEEVKGDYIKPKIKLKDIERVFENLYAASVVEHELIYLPVHQVEYASKNGNRRIYIEGHNGKVIEP